MQEKMLHVTCDRCGKTVYFHVNDYGDPVHCDFEKWCEHVGSKWHDLCPECYSMAIAIKAEYQRACEDFIASAGEKN